MSTVLATPFSVVLLALKAQVAHRTGLDPSRVLVTQRDPEDCPHFGAAQDVLLKAGSELPVEDVIDGCGRYDNRRRRDVKVSVRTRVQLDTADSDLVHLTAGDDSESAGHLALEDAIVDGLELFIVTDKDDNALTLQCRVGNLTESRKLNGAKTKNAGWLCSTFSVMVEYVRALDTSIV